MGRYSILVDAPTSCTTFSPDPIYKRRKMNSTLECAFAMDSIVAIKEAAEIEDFDAVEFHLVNIIEWYSDEKHNMGSRARAYLSRIISSIKRVKVKLEEQMADEGIVIWRIP